MKTKKNNVKNNVMTKKYQPGNAEAIHKTVVELFKIGAVSKKQMKKFDDMCLMPEKKSDAKIIIRQLMKKENVNEDYIAYALNVSTNQVRKWIKGEAKPREPERKLLIIAEKNGLEALA